MVRNNSTRPGKPSTQTCHSYTLLTSCFSHEDSMHLFFNGFTFYFMAPHVLGILGNVSFLGLYLGGAYLVMGFVFA